VLQFGFGAVKGLQGPDLARFPGQHGQTGSGAGILMRKREDRGQPVDKGGGWPLSAPDEPGIDGGRAVRAGFPVRSVNRRAVSKSPYDDRASAVDRCCLSRRIPNR